MKKTVSSLFLGNKPRAAPGNLPARERRAYLSTRGKFVASRTLHATPKWLKQADICLHDAKRNMNGVCWAIMEYMEKTGTKLGLEEKFYNVGAPRIHDKRLLPLLRLVRDRLKTENEIARISLKKTVTGEDETRASMLAARINSINDEMRARSGFLAQELGGTEGQECYQMYLDTFSLGKAALKPLIERSPRRYYYRHETNLPKFFSEYSKQKFLDREGHMVEVRLGTVENLHLKVNREGMATALGNLIQDAINHTPGTPVHITVMRENGHASIKVFNEGNPIPEERLPSIGHDAYWSRGKGRLRGRGKISVRLFCEDHGGRFKAYNMRLGGKHFGPCMEMDLPLA